MRYLSPTFFFGDKFTLPLDSRAIQRERKRLLAELELADGDSIGLGGRSFMKNELIDYFGELQQEKIVAWHLAIAADPVLLRFLQDEKIHEGDRFGSDAVYEDPEFRVWVAPYFRAALTVVAQTSFEQADASGLRALLANRLLISPEDQEQCWRFISDILEKNIALFDHYFHRTQRHSPPMRPVTEISAYLLHGYFNVIRVLPDPRLSRLKDRYAISVLHPAVAVFNRNRRNRALAITWVKEALNLAVSENTKAAVRGKLNELQAILKRDKQNALARNILIVVLLAGLTWGYFDGVDSEKPFIPMLSPKPARSHVQPDSTIDTLRVDSVPRR